MASDRHHSEGTDSHIKLINNLNCSQDGPQKIFNRDIENLPILCVTSQFQSILSKTSRFYCKWLQNDGAF